MLDGLLCGIDCALLWLLLQLDLTERAVLLGQSCKCSEEHATVADRAAGLAEAKSGKLHESASIKSFKSNSSGNGAENPTDMLDTRI